MTPFSRFLMSFGACILTLLAIMMLVKDVGEKPVCWWKLNFFHENTFHQHTEKFSPTHFTNIHLNFCSYFSPTCKKNFTNILHQHTFKFLYSPTYSFTNIQKILHQHTFFRQHISPTSLQSFFKTWFVRIF